MLKDRVDNDNFLWPWISVCWRINDPRKELSEDEDEEVEEAASEELEDDGPVEKKDPEDSFFIFEAADTIRVTCKIINDHTAFVNFILLIIGLSSIALAMDDPISQNPELVSILWHLDLIFTSIFIFETIIKENLKTKLLVKISILIELM